MMRLMAKSLDEVPENLRGCCKVENETVSLDETLLRTKADLDAVSEAKRKEVNDHNATKAGLAAWRKLGESPEAVLEKLSDLESRAGNGSDLTEKLAAVQREKRQIENERNTLKTELDGIKPQFEKQQKQLHEAKIAEVLEKSVAVLKGVDAVRLTRSLKKDIALGLIDLDESGEGLVVKTGERFEDYAMGQANDYDFKLRNTPGGSNPGVPKIPANLQSSPKPQLPGSGEGFLDDEVAAQLDS